MYKWLFNDAASKEVMGKKENLKLLDSQDHNYRPDFWAGNFQDSKNIFKKLHMKKETE